MSLQAQNFEHALIEQLRIIGENIAALTAQLQHLEGTLTDLIEPRDVQSDE